MKLHEKTIDDVLVDFANGSGELTVSSWIEKDIKKWAKAVVENCGCISIYDEYWETYKRCPACERFIEKFKLEDL